MKNKTFTICYRKMLSWETDLVKVSALSESETKKKYFDMNIGGLILACRLED